MTITKKLALFVFIGILVGTLFLTSAMNKITDHNVACTVSYIGGFVSVLAPLVLATNFNPRGTSGNTKGEPRG